MLKKQPGFKKRREFGFRKKHNVGFKKPKRGLK